MPFLNYGILVKPMNLYFYLKVMHTSLILFEDLLLAWFCEVLKKYIRGKYFLVGKRSGRTG